MIISSSPTPFQGLLGEVLQLADVQFERNEAN